MTATKKIKSIVKQTIALATGDNPRAIGERNFRSADSAFNTQLHNLKGQRIQLEDNVALAEENLKKARCNSGQRITDHIQYVKDVLNAREQVTKANKALKDLDYNISVHEEELAILAKEEDDDTV